jgi:poly(ADP-ribose) glycohydrolase ARH3
LRSKYLGSMFGCALGDAIGELAFAYGERGQLVSVVGKMQVLQYTDDTAMAIGLAESIAEKRTIDPQHLGDTFLRNFLKEPWRGYASGPPTIFRMVRSSGMSYTEAAKSLFLGEGSLGNGAAMRIAPVGLFFHGSEDLYNWAGLSAQVTHAHPVGMDGAAIQAMAVAKAVGMDPDAPFSAQDFIEGLISFSRTKEMKEKLVMVGNLIMAGIGPEKAADRLGREVSVDKSLPFALYSFLRHPKSFEECLWCAVLHGGDRDTLGAMACSVSGAYLGIEALPDKWLGKVENADAIIALVEKLMPR